MKTKGTLEFQLALLHPQSPLTAKRGLFLKVLSIVLLLFVGECHTITTNTSKEGASNQRANEAPSYQPEGSLGIRFKKNILNDQDLTYIEIASHIEEVYQRKKDQLMFFEDTPSTDNLTTKTADEGTESVRYEKFLKKTQGEESTNLTDTGEPKAYLSTNYYKPRFPFIEDPQKRGQQPFNHGGITVQAPAENNINQQAELPKDNAYLNYALNVKNFYDVPVDHLKVMDEQQTIEGFLQKRAKRHASSNFNTLKGLLGSEYVSSVEALSKISYTFGEPDLISNMTDGVTPQLLTGLSPSNQVYEFFTSTVEISPNRFSFGESEILIPQMELVKITNKHQSQPLHLKGIFTNTPELTIYIADGKDLPYQLEPGESVQFKVVFIPEILGFFQGLIEIVIGDYVFMEPVNAYTLPNIYGVEPVYITDALINENIELPVSISNVLSDEVLVIEEMYSTQDFLQLKWPNKVKVSERIDINNMADSSISHYLKVPALSTKHVVSLVFQTAQAGDYFAIIHFRTSQADIIRMPVYFHVNTDVIRFYPTLIDFGLVALNFDQLKVELRGRVKCSESLQIQDMFVPIHEARLDFMMIEAKRVNQGKPIRKSQEVYFGYVTLIPSRSGYVDEKIIVQANVANTNITHRLEIPIIGYITSNSQALNNQARIKQQDFGLVSDLPSPHLAFDVSKQIINDASSRMLFKIPQFKPKILEQELVITNSFNHPLMVNQIINQNAELEIQLTSEVKQSMKLQNMNIMPGQTFHLGKVILSTSALKILQGPKFISLQLNDTMVSVQIAIHDRSLLCVWGEENAQFRYIQCGQGYEINFGTVAINEPKYKQLNITNMNPQAVTIESLTKPYLDDLQVHLDGIVDKHGNTVSYPVALENENLPYTDLITSKRTKQTVNLTLQPYNTAAIRFSVQAKAPKQKASRIEFLMQTKEIDNVNFGYNYQVVEGTVSLIPANMRYSPAFPGMIQHKVLAVKSTFDVPILIKQVHCSDPRIISNIVNKVIMPKNKTELGVLTFDPGQSSQNIIWRDFDLQNLIFQPLGQIDPSMQQNILSALNGQHLGPNTQISMLNGNQIELKNLGKGQPWNNQNQAISANDIFQFREKQKQWERIAKDGQTEINAEFTIETNIIQKINLPVKAYLTKPALVNEDVLDFGLVQVGTSTNKSISIHNPSHSPIVVQLLLSPDSSYRQEILQNFNDTFNPLEREIHSMLQDDFQKETTEDMTASKQSYLNMYCARKLKERSYGGLADTESFQLEELLVNQKFDIFKLCHSLLNQTDSALLKTIKHNLEPFFKDIYNAEKQEPNQQKVFKQMVKGRPIFNKVHDNANVDSYNPQLDLDYQVQQISWYSAANPEDPLRGTLQSKTQDGGAHDKQYVSTIQEMIKNTINKLFQGRNLRQKVKPGQNKSMLPLTLKDKALHDLIIKNDTKIMHDQPKKFGLSHFFINPKVQGQIFIVEPKSNLTIDDAIIFQPLSLQAQNVSMTLLLKNNLTALYPIELKGSGGTGLVKFDHVFKQPQNKVPIQEQNSRYLKRVQGNSSFQIDTESARQDILAYVYGVQPDSSLQPQLKQASNKTSRAQSPSLSKPENAILFQISLQELLTLDETLGNETLPLDQAELENIINARKNTIKVNKFHTRVFAARNTGNLPVQIDNISIEGKHCQGFGFTIENCHAFTLQPGEHHWIHVTYETDFSIARLRKSLNLEGEHFIQHFDIQVSIPLKFLQIAQQLAPLSPFEQKLQFPMQIAITLMAVAAVLVIGRESYQYKRHSKAKALSDQKVRNILQSSRYSLPVDSKLIPHIYKSQLPLIKEAGINDHVVAQYQSAYEKFENPSQLLLKEISNICAKKNLVILEFQKQALEAEKERRLASKLNMSSCLEKKVKDDKTSHQQHSKALAKEMTWEGETFNEQDKNADVISCSKAPSVVSLQNSERSEKEKPYIEQTPTKPDLIEQGVRSEDQLSKLKRDEVSQQTSPAEQKTAQSKKKKSAPKQSKQQKKQEQIRQRTIEQQQLQSLQRLEEEAIQKQKDEEKEKEEEILASKDIPQPEEKPHSAFEISQRDQPTSSVQESVSSTQTGPPQSVAQPVSERQGAKPVQEQLPKAEAISSRVQTPLDHQVDLITESLSDRQPQVLTEEKDFQEVEISSSQSTPFPKMEESTLQESQKSTSYQSQSQWQEQSRPILESYDGTSQSQIQGKKIYQAPSQPPSSSGDTHIKKIYQEQVAKGQFQQLLQQNPNRSKGSSSIGGCSAASQYLRRGAQIGPASYQSQKVYQGQTNYAKGRTGRDPYQYDEESSYDRRNQSFTSQYAIPQQSEPQTMRRVVINTMKTANTAQTKPRGRGNHNFRQSIDFEEQQYKHHGSFHSSHQYPLTSQRRSRDEADEQYHDEQRMIATKKVSRGSYGREKREYYAAQPEDEYPPIKTHADESICQGDESFVSFVHEPQNETQEKVSKPDQQSLSKDELAPFFKSKRKETEESQNAQALPSPANGLSLFSSFNPFGVGASDNMDMSGDILGSSHIPEESKDLIREEKEVQEESEEENQRATDFYNAFKSASSLFQKPAFGSTCPDQTDQKLSQGPRGLETGDQKLSGSSSLFTGSLFGSGGGATHFNAKLSPLYSSNDFQASYQNEPQDKCGGEGEDEEEDQQIFSSSNALSELRQGSEPLDSYSLFGNMTYQTSNQPKGRFISGKHYQEDEEQKEEEQNQGYSAFGKTSDYSIHNKGAYNLFG